MCCPAALQQLPTTNRHTSCDQTPPRYPAVYPSSSSSSSAPLLCWTVNPTQHLLACLSLPHLAPSGPPPNTPPHACRVVHVRAVPPPAPPCASRSITAWHVPLVLPRLPIPPCPLLHTHSSPRLSRALSIVQFTCLTPLLPPFAPLPSISLSPCPRCN